MNKGVNSACDLTLSFVVPYGFMCVGLSFRVTLRMGSCFIKKVYPPGTGTHGRGLARTLVGPGFLDFLFPQASQASPLDTPGIMVAAEPMLAE